MIDLQVSILEEFAEAGRYALEDAFAAASDFIARRTAQANSDSRAYRKRMMRDPEKLAKEHARQAAWRAENPHYSRDYMRRQRASIRARSVRDSRKRP